MINLKEHSDFIEALGGNTKVAQHLGLIPNRPANWHHNGIPWRWRPALAGWAKQRRIKLPAKFLIDPNGSVK